MGTSAPRKWRGIPLALDEALGPLDVMAGGSVLEGFDLEAVGLIPVAGSEVVVIHASGRERGLAPLTQQIGEQMVVAIPAPLGIEADDEQVCPIEVFEGLLTGGRGIEQHGITEGAAEPIEDGRPKQEGLDGFGLPLEDFLDQVVEHKVVAAGERPDEACDVFAALQRDRRQLQARDPALGASFQGGDVVRREVQAHHLVEKVGDLGRGEAEVGAAQLGQLPSGAQSGQGQGWILTGGDDQVQPGRQVLDQEGQGVVDRPGIEDVVVVENEDDIARDGGDVVEQGRQRRLEWRGLRRLEHGQYPFADPGRNRLQRPDEIGQETAGVAVAFIERQPRHRSPAARDPFADQRGLAEAGGSGDQGQPVAGREAVVQTLHESRTGDAS